MDELAEVYHLETVEQLRALADDLRVRIVEALGAEARTVTQLAGRLGQPANKLHYHVRELERVGLVRQVETRERGGILEKYFRAVAHSFDAPATLLQSVPPDESQAAVGEFLRSLTDGCARAYAAALRRGLEQAGPMVLSRSEIWATVEESRQLIKGMAALLEPYTLPRAVEGEERRSVVQMFYTSSLADEAQGSSPGVATDGEPDQRPATDLPRMRKSFAAGVFHYGRNDLEEIVAQGEALDLSVFGLCSFAPEVTPDLVDRAFARFRHRGVLNAPPQVREMLKRKEAPAAGYAQPR